MKISIVPVRIIASRVCRLSSDNDNLYCFVAAFIMTVVLAGLWVVGFIWFVKE